MPARVRVMIVVAVWVAAAFLPLPASAAAASDLSIALSSARPSVSVGDDVALRASVTNAGPDDAVDAVVLFELPAGLVAEFASGCDLDAVVRCPIGTVPRGATVDVAASVSVTGAGPLVPAAVADAADADPVPQNDRAETSLRGTGRTCEVVGTRGRDELRGRGILCGLGGNDLLLGGRRRDVLLGGSGRDTLTGSAERDRLDGGEGVDACARDDGERLRGCERRVFAMAGRVPMIEPSVGVVGYGYHQSLFRTAMGLRPIEPGVVMSSRGRGTGATTAADVVIPSRERVRSPVTGTVVGVIRYRLYCQELDWKVVIEPQSHPDLRVLVLHMARPSVSEGEEVQAGATRIGRAESNDQPSSQQNRYFPDRYPHVHIEVERDRASPTPGCAA